MAVSILNEAQKVAIAAARANGTSAASLAKTYNVSTRTIGRVVAEQALSGSTNDQRLGEAISQVESGNSHPAEWDESAQQFVLTEEQPTEPDEFDYQFVVNSTTIGITCINKTHNRIEGDVLVDNNHDKFLTARQLIVNGNMSQEAVAEAYRLLDVKLALKEQTEGRVTVDPNGGRVYYVDELGNQQGFPYQLSERIIEAAMEGNDAVNRLLKFADRLTHNPSYRAVRELYRFMVATDLEIDDEGRVICWKVVRANFHDCHSGTMDNSVGLTVRVPRNAVDENSNNTCSFGLHVCSRSYIRHFGGPDKRVVKVAVDPADFVAIPSDYNDAKARVCGYEVIRDATDEYLAQR